jgi:hypothetical protein
MFPAPVVLLRDAKILSPSLTPESGKSCAMKMAA